MPGASESTLAPVHHTGVSLYPENYIMLDEIARAITPDGMTPPNRSALMRLLISGVYDHLIARKVLAKNETLAPASYRKDRKLLRLID